MLRALAPKRERSINGGGLMNIDTMVNKLCDDLGGRYNEYSGINGGECIVGNTIISFEEHPDRKSLIGAFSVHKDDMYMDVHIDKKYNKYSCQYSKTPNDTISIKCGNRNKLYMTVIGSKYEKWLDINNGNVSTTIKI